MTITFMGLAAWVYVIITVVYGICINDVKERIGRIFVYLICSCIAFAIGPVIGNSVAVYMDDVNACYAWTCVVLWIAALIVCNGLEELKEVVPNERSVITNNMIHRLIGLFIIVGINVYIVKHKWYNIVESLIDYSALGVSRAVFFTVLNLILFCVLMRTSAKYQAIYKKRNEMKKKQDIIKKKEKYNQLKLSVFKHLGIKDTNASFETVYAVFKQRGYEYQKSQSEDEKEKQPQTDEMAADLTRCKTYAELKKTQKNEKPTTVEQLVNTFSFRRDTFWSSFAVIFLVAGVCSIVGLPVFILNHLSSDGLSGVGMNKDYFIMFFAFCFVFWVFIFTTTMFQKTVIRNVAPKKVSWASYIVCAVCSLIQCGIVLITFYSFFAIGWHPDKLRFVGETSEIVGCIQHSVTLLKPIYPESLNMTFIEN